MASLNHHQQTGGVQNLQILNQETTLGSHRLLIETLIIHIPLVEVTLVLETLILEDIPDKTQVGILQEDIQLVEVTLTNLEEGITQTKTLLGVIQLQAAIPTNLEEAVIPTSTLQVEAIQLLGDTPTSQAEAAIQTSIQVVILLLGVTRTQDMEVAIRSEEGALGRAGVHQQAPTLVVILVVE